MKLFRLVLFVFALVAGQLACANITSTTNRTGPYVLGSLPATVAVVFPFQASSELLVLNLGQNGTSNDPPTVLTLNSDYTVTGGGYNATYNMQSGNVVLVSTGTHAVAVNDRIMILRNVPVNQTTSFTTGVLTAATIERAMDKQATISQMGSETISRALRFEAGETLDGTLVRSARSGKYLGFDSNGAITYLDGSGGGGGGTQYTAGAGLVLNSNEFSVNPVQSLTSLTVTNPITGSVTGNAATATALQNSRTINGTAFNGTANITVAAAAGTLTGTSLAGNVLTSSLTSGAVGTFGSMATQNAGSVAITGGSIDSASVTGLAAPTNGTDAANKAYVDSISAGITPRTGVLVATTANIVLNAPQTIDGVALVAGNRVLVKNQAAPAQNGIYDVAAGAWVRSTDSNTAPELLFGYYYFVSGGTVNGSTSWFIQTAPTVLGVDPVVFSQFSASQNYLAGTGLSLVGNTFSLNSAQSGLTITGSAFNGTIGATTPSSAAFTTQTTTGNSFFGNLVMKANQLNETLTNATSSVNINFDGYAGGTTQFRDLNVYDGKNGLTATIAGSTKLATLYGGLTFANTGARISADFTNATTTNRLHFQSSTVNGVTYVGAVPNGAATDSAFVVLNSSGMVNSGYGSLRSTSTFTAIDSGAIGAGTVQPLELQIGAAMKVRIATSGDASFVGAISNTTAAIERTTKGNFNVVLNVKDYGALGDGATNDTVAIAAAVAAMPATNAILFFPSGTYVTDTVTITGKTGLTVIGSGAGSTTIKNRTGGQCLNISSTTGCLIRDLTFNGNCTVRTAGAHAVVADASQLIFTNNNVVNSGQYTLLVGSAATVTDVSITNTVCTSSYADGINIQNVQRFVVANCTIDGVDDDGIAIGYNGSGHAQYGVISGNFVRARNDLGTGTGRGIWLGTASDILVVGNVIDTIKQTGIFVNDDSTGTRPTRISIKNNKIRNVATSSGHGIALYKTSYVTLEGNDVTDQASGNCIEIADWQHLSIIGGTLVQSVNTFARGIHADEGGGWAASWDDLVISDVVIRMVGASTNVCIYLSPDPAYTMNIGSISNVKGYQVTAGDYIAIATARMGTRWKLGNNVSLTGNTVSPAASAGVYTVFNNN